MFGIGLFIGLAVGIIMGLFIHAWVESTRHSLQQLKAEIAALANEVQLHDEGEICMCQSLLVEKLRQLSAV